MMSQKTDWLRIQPTQQLGKVRWNRLFEKIAVHFPKVIADANPDGTGYTGIGIIGGDRPFSEGFSLPQAGFPHSAPPMGALSHDANHGQPEPFHQNVG
jgi:hypothetical protein